jgi:hypothetical protein
MVGPGAGSDIITGSSTATSLTLNPRTGATQVRRLLVDAPDAERTELNDIAAAIRVDWAEPVSAFTISTRGADRNIREHVGPGNYCWVEWPGVVEDTSNNVEFMGDVYAPRKMRVWSMGWPVERGMGVYYRRTDSGGTPEWVDLSEYVEWSSADPVLTVGYRRRPPMETTERLGVRLAAHQAINQRANDTKAQASTIEYTSGGAVDATAASDTAFGDWLSVGNVTQPAWARAANVTWFMTGCTATAVQTTHEYDLRITVDGVACPSGRFSTPDAPRWNAGLQTEKITLTGTGGSVAVKLQAYRRAGATARARFGTVSKIVVRIEWLTA